MEAHRKKLQSTLIENQVWALVWVSFVYLAKVFFGFGGVAFTLPCVASFLRSAAAANVPR